MSADQWTTRYTLHVYVDVPTDADGPDIGKRDLEKAVIRGLWKTIGYKSDAEVMDEERIDTP